MGPMVLNANGSVQGSARSFPTPLTSLFGRNSPITKLYPNNSITRSNILTWRSFNNQPVEVDWVSGACMVVRRAALETVGGFDERFFLYWEDTDLCRRIKNAGWKIIYFPKIKVTHFVGKSSKYAPYHSIYQFHKSCYYLWSKNTKLPLSILLPFAFLSLMIRGLIAVLYHYLNYIRFRIIDKKGYSLSLKNIIFKIYCLFVMKKGNINEKRLTSDQKKVLHIITRLIVGGAQENTIYSAELMDGKEYNVDVLSGSQTGPEGSLIENAIKRGVRLTIQDSLVREISPLKDIVAFLQLLKFIRYNRYDIVHTHSSKAGILGRWAAWLNGVPIIVHTVHGWGFHRYQHPVVRQFYILAERLSALITDRLIAVTKKDIEKGVAAGIGVRKQYALIRSGIDLKQFSVNDSRKAAIRAELGIPENAIVIGTVTRLSVQKAPHVFIETAAIVNERSPDTFFVIVGGGPLQDELERLAEKLGISGRVLFTGIRDDVQDVLHAFDIFMLTSLWEGLPRVIPQAIASGVPVIASRVDGNAEIINHNENGLLVEPRDANGFAEDAIDLINNREKALRIRNNATKNIGEYNVHKMVGNIEDLYKLEFSKK
ncbi:putative Glycosyltransferase, group 1 family protein [Desulfosarcina cetonica]|nr:putative Glycosyltransferase, group 1 family protein [Desulfosarcina cetonica]